MAELGFPGLGWWPLTLLGMAALVLALGRDSARWNALVGLVFGLAFFLPHITFVAAAVGPVPWLALAVTEAGFVALFGAAWSWARRGEVIWRAARFQVPVFGIDSHGSLGSSEPSWISSTEMPSGERTKAMCPSRGGRLIV